MRCVVIGSKELSCVILDELIQQGHDVPLVISRDDEPGMKLWHDMGHRSLKQLAIDHGISVLEGVNVNESETLQVIRDAQPDIILSCFWSDLFKSELLSIPPRGVFNFHTAYLPKNRGSRPIPWAMIKGDEYAGITLHKMLLGVDDGPMVAQKRVRIERDDTGKSLYDKVMNAGYELVHKIVALFGSNSEVLIEQDESEATFHLRGEPYGGQYNYFWTDEEVDRFKRSCVFPPFKAFRKPPQALADEAEVKVIVSSTKDERGWNNPVNCTQIDAELSRFRINSGGSVEVRRELRTLIPSGVDHGYFPNHSTGLFAYYPILESMKRGGYEASISLYQSLEGSIEKSQPFRYENGLLELPINCVNPSVEDLKSQVERALSMSSENQCPIYLHVMLDERFGEYDIAMFTTEFSQQIQNASISLVTYHEVCAEFNTAYEDIST